MIAKTRLVQGVQTPSFFYGTAWKEERTQALVAQALELGFRAIDTANQRKHYFEAAVGAAVTASKLPREQLFLQSKFTYRRGQDARLPYDPSASPEDQVRQSMRSSLEHFQTDHLDSLLLHGPSMGEGLADLDWRTWEAMAELQREGQTRLIGISNVSPEQLQLLVSQSRTRPAFVQNRCYASAGWDADVRAVCDAHQIVYQGFSLLTANRRELARPGFSRLQKQLGRTVAQIAFRLALQLGMIPITGSSDANHLKEDLAAFDFELSGEEMASLSPGL